MERYIPIFGDRVRFANPSAVHSDFQGKDFCLLGASDSAFALIEWEKRGGYGFHFLSGSAAALLVLAPEVK